MRKLIYLAAPLFSQSERVLNLRLCTMMEHFCDVYLPQRDGYLLSDLIKTGMNPTDAHEQIFNSDMVKLRSCDAVVAVLDGRTIDEGVAFELGTAWVRGKACVGYHTDFRTLTPWGISLIIAGALSHKFGKETDLVAWAQDFASGLAQAAPFSVEQLDKLHFGRLLHTRDG